MDHRLPPLPARLRMSVELNGMCRRKVWHKDVSDGRVSYYRCVVGGICYFNDCVDIDQLRWRVTVAIIIIFSSVRWYGCFFNKIIILLDVHSIKRFYLYRIYTDRLNISTSWILSTTTVWNIINILIFIAKTLPEKKKTFV